MEKEIYRRKHSLEDYLWISLLSLIVLIPNLYLVFAGSDLSGSIINKIAYLMISIVVFLIPSLFLKARTFFLFQGIFVLLAPIEIAHIYQSKMPVTAGFLMTILDTNFGEAWELLSSLRWIVAGLLLLWIFYFVVVFKKIKNEFILKSKSLRIYFLSGILIFVLLGMGYFYRLARNTSDDKRAVFSKTVEYFRMKFDKIYPCDILIKLNKVFVDKKMIAEKSELLKNFYFHAVKTDTIPEREIYIFVIGETARFDNFSLNGYSKPTSPLLEKQKNLISYTDFYSEANVTSFSLPFLLTKATTKNANLRQSEKTFVDAFKEAGFKTYWIANQSAGNQFVRRISKDADEEFFTTVDFDANENYDEKLWVYLDEVLNRNDRKVLIILHTLGSHFRYNFRYPSSFNIFHPSFEGTFDYGSITKENKEKLINTYDNSILYTDYFLAHTIQKIDSLQSVSALVYTSDHGENLYDTSDNIALHANVITTKYDFHVPLFIWTSDRYRDQYSEKTAALQNNKDKKLNSSVLFYSMLDMAGITFPGQRMEKSIASGALQADSIRYFFNLNEEIMKAPE